MWGFGLQASEMCAMGRDEVIQGGQSSKVEEGAGCSPSTTTSTYKLGRGDWKKGYKHPGSEGSRGR